MKAQPQGSHFVDGRYVEDKAGAPIEVIYPATGAVIAVLHEATGAVVEAALASAKRAQAEWAAMKPVERSRILRRAADMIRDRGEELALLETLDTGKPIQETRVADWPSGADSLEWFAGLAMQGLLAASAAHPDIYADETPERTAAASVARADALLSALAKESDQ